MQVDRVPLPGSATIAVAGNNSLILLDHTLTRDESVLVVQSMFPGVHPDVVDHWLDKVFPREPAPFRVALRSCGVVLGSVALAFVPAGAHASPAGDVKPVLNVHTPLTVAVLLDEDLNQPWETQPQDTIGSRTAQRPSTATDMSDRVITPARRSAAAGHGTMHRHAPHLVVPVMRVEEVVYHPTHPAPAVHPATHADKGRPGLHGRPWFGKASRMVPQAFGKAHITPMNRHAAVWQV